MRIRVKARAVAVLSGVIALTGMGVGASLAEAARPLCAGKRATLVGTARANKITGTRRADVIFAGGGNDRVTAGGGNDIVCGAAGNDKISGGAGNDRILGAAGNDDCAGDRGRDQCDGGSPAGNRASDFDYCWKDIEIKRGCSADTQFVVTSVAGRYDNLHVRRSDGDSFSNPCDEYNEVHWRVGLGTQTSRATAHLFRLFSDARGRPVFGFEVAWNTFNSLASGGQREVCPPGNTPKPPCSYPSTASHGSSVVVTHDVDSSSRDPMSLVWGYPVAGVVCEPRDPARSFSIPLSFQDEPALAIRQVPLASLGGDTVVLHHSGSRPFYESDSFEMTVTLRRLPG